MMLQIIIESYTNLIAGKPITDIISNVYTSLKRFDIMPKSKLEKGESHRQRSATAFKK